MNTNHGKLWLAALALMVVLGLQARATTVTATLDPTQISVGESAQLTVTVSGTDNQEAIPSVNGLEITNVEHSNFMNIINGSMSSSTSNIYSVTPQSEGTFIIPAIHAGNAASQPITLRVGKGAASAAPAPAPSSPAPSNGPVVLPPPSANSSPAAEPAATDKFGSVEITIPQKEFYEGELVPIVIKVFIPQDVQPNLNDLPQFASDGFTLNPLSTKLDQNAEAINGRVYDVLTWHSALTAVKTGEYPISLKVPLTVVEYQRMPQPTNADDLFNNFFRSFATMGRKQDVTLSNKPMSLKVLPLPQANRPADFGGAVGQFEVEAGATPVKVNAGDPITLQLKISGTGNFDRVSSAMLAANSQWKTYSTKNQFEGTDDSVGYQGTKTFEQPVIPSDSSVKAIPSLSFSYFNPETREYVTRATAPIAVSVTGGVTTPIAGSSFSGPVPDACVSRIRFAAQPDRGGCVRLHASAGLSQSVVCRRAKPALPGAAERTAPDPQPPASRATGPCPGHGHPARDSRAGCGHGRGYAKSPVRRVLHPCANRLATASRPALEPATRDHHGGGCRGATRRGGRQHSSGFRNGRPSQLLGPSF